MRKTVWQGSQEWTWEVTPIMSLSENNERGQSKFTPILVSDFLSSAGNDIAMQRTRSKARIFDEYVDEYNASCLPRWPDYKRFNLKPGANPFIVE
jgi:hypothetical protein